MAHHPEIVTQVLEAGADVDLSNTHSGFPPEQVTAWVQLAATKGVRLTIGVGYEPALYAQWAQLGGKYLTVRF